jgi:hypothetical protein
MDIDETASPWAITLPCIFPDIRVEYEYTLLSQLETMMHFGYELKQHPLNA